MSRSYFILLLVFLLFLVLRLPGLDLQYHQDEYKWAFLVNPENNILGSVTDPPLSELLFVMAAEIFGYDHLRYMPFVFGVISFGLLFYFVKEKFGHREAFLSSFFFSVAYYNVWASLLVDRDGAFIPAIFLTCLIFFYKWLSAEEIRKKIIFGSLLALFIAVGFLTRLHFILVIGSLLLEFIIYNRRKLYDKNFLFKYGSLVVIYFMSLLLVLLNGHLIYPYFKIATMFNYSSHFIVSSRNWFQIFTQFFKALFYISPLFLASFFFIPKNHITNLRPLLLFIGCGLLFYLVLFDFSSGALDRYFVFLIVPAVITGGIVTADIFRDHGGVKDAVITGLICAGGLFFLQFLPHYVPALYPKPEWYYRVFDLRWNFVMPFTGGSGPLGFYISWLFISLTWIATSFLVVLAKFREYFTKKVWVIILILGIQYNLVFTEEYLFGKINGNSDKLLKNVQEFVIKNKSIKEVITYNDIGAYELRKAGKYRRRLYVAPKFEGSYQDVLNNFKSYYMVLEIPKIDPKSIYAEYFSSCEILYEEWSGVIPARVYDCKNAKNI